MGGIGEKGSARAAGGSGAGANAGTGAGEAMGAVGAGIGLGTSLYGLLKNAGDSRRQYKRQVRDLYMRQQQENRRKKNLLEEQLASRRARIGALGMSADGSNAAGTRRVIDNTYRDVIDDNTGYDTTYRDMEKEYAGQRKRDLLEYFINNGSQLIK